MTPIPFDVNDAELRKNFFDQYFADFLRYFDVHSFTWILGQKIACFKITALFTKNFAFFL